MIIQEINFSQLPFLEESIFDSIYQHKTNGFVIQNFLNPNEVNNATNVFAQASVQVNTPFEGYRALPRPFNFLDLNSPDAYYQECEDFQRITEVNGLFETFQKKMKLLAKQTSVSYATPYQNVSLSKAWASLRELQVNKGKFELHCGRLFKQFNSEFYDHFAGKAEVERQLSFFIMIQKPLTDCDIEIYDAHWNDYEMRNGEHTLISHKGQTVDVRSLPSYKAKMKEGDMLIFDGAHYWHQVSGFGGEKSRYTFGGFITKFKEGNQVMVWA